MSVIKSLQGKTIDKKDIPSSHRVIFTVYAHGHGIAIGLEEAFQLVLKDASHEEAAEIMADVSECIRRALNSVRCVA